MGKDKRGSYYNSQRATTCRNTRTRRGGDKFQQQSPISPTPLQMPRLITGYPINFPMCENNNGASPLSRSAAPSPNNGFGSDNRSFTSPRHGIYGGYEYVAPALALQQNTSVTEKSNNNDSMTNPQQPIPQVDVTIEQLQAKVSVPDSIVVETMPMNLLEDDENVVEVTTEPTTGENDNTGVDMADDTEAPKDDNTATEENNNETPDEIENNDDSYLEEKFLQCSQITLRSYENLKNDLKIKKIEIDSKIADLKSENGNLNDIIEELKKEMALKDSKIEEDCQKGDEMIALVTKIELDIDKKNEEIERNGVKIKNLTQELEESKCKILSLQNEIISLQDSNTEATTKLDAIKNILG